MGTEFEREVRRIFEERDFREEQKAIKRAQEAILIKKEERKKRQKKQYYTFRWADRLCIAISGVLVGLSVWKIVDHNPAAGILFALVSAMFLFSSCVFCELAERNNAKR